MGRRPHPETEPVWEAAPAQGSAGREEEVGAGRASSGRGRTCPRGRKVGPGAQGLPAQGVCGFSTEPRLRGGAGGRGIRAAPCVPERLGLRAPTDREAGGPHLVGVVGKVDLVEYLGGFVLDGLHLHQVWGVLPGPVPKNQGAEGAGQGAAGSRGEERRGIWRRDTLLPLPVHHFLPGDSHVSSQSLQGPSAHWDGDGTRHIGLRRGHTAKGARGLPAVTCGGGCLPGGLERATRPV